MARRICRSILNEFGREHLLRDRYEVLPSGEQVIAGWHSGSQTAEIYTRSGGLFDDGETIGAGGVGADIELLANGNLVVAHGGFDDLLRFSVNDGTQWQTEVVLDAGPGSTVVGQDLEIDPTTGRPQLALSIRGEEGLNFPYIVSSSGASIIDDSVDIFSSVSFEIDANGESHALYWDGLGRVIYASTVPEPSSLAAIGLGLIWVIRRRRPAY